MSFPPYGYPGQSQHSIYVYHRRAHTDTDQAPLERSGVADPRLLPTSELLSEAFLWSEHRKVTKVATVSLHGNTDEVDGALVGRRVELGFDPFALAAVQVRRDGRTLGTGVPHRIGRHTHSQAHADTPAPAPERFGNDYSRLIQARADHADREAAGPGINFYALTESTEAAQMPGQLQIPTPNDKDGP